MSDTEELQLYRLVIGHVYDADLRKQIAALGLRRLTTLQWISKTGNRYELFLSEDEEKRVSRLDKLEKNRRVHILEKTATSPDGSNRGIHGMTLNAFSRQVEFGRQITEDYLDRWNAELYRKSAEGVRLKEYVPEGMVSFENLLFLPDPTCRGSYIYGMKDSGKVAAKNAWLNLPDGEFIIPTDMTEYGAFASLSSGSDLHRYEVENFKTPLQAARFTARVLNASPTSYVACIRKMTGKGDGEFSTDDFFRNSRKEICRIEIVHEDSGISLLEIPIIPTLADCLDSLLSPVLRNRVLSSE